MARKKQTKSAFIRKQSSTMSAQDVVRAAKAAGVTLTDTYVHSVRSADRAAARTARKTTKRAARAPKTSTPSPVSAVTQTSPGLLVGIKQTFETAEAAFAALLTELGHARAQKLLSAWVKAARTLHVGSAA